MCSELEVEPLPRPLRFFFLPAGGGGSKTVTGVVEEEPQPGKVPPGGGDDPNGDASKKKVKGKPGPGDSGDDGSDSSDSSKKKKKKSGKKKNRKGRSVGSTSSSEHKKTGGVDIKVGILPRVAQYDAWRNTLMQNIDAASNRTDSKALTWAQEVLDLDKFPDEYFADTEPQHRFAKLDKKLCAAMQRIVHGELGRTMTERVNIALKTRRVVRGRELLRMVINYYQTNKTAEKVFRQADLMKLKMADPANGNLEKFINDWDKVRGGMAADVSDDIAEYLFYEAIRRHKKLEVEIKHYERVEDEDPPHADRCCAYLYQSVMKLIRRERKESVRDQRSKQVDAMLGGREGTAQGAAGVKGARGRGRGKGGGKGKSRGGGKGGGSQSGSEGGSRSSSKARATHTPRGGNRICHFYKKGKCRDGNKCKFAHSGHTPSTTPRGSQGAAGAPGNTPRKGRGKGTGKTPREGVLISVTSMPRVCHANSWTPTDRANSHIPAPKRGHLLEHPQPHARRALALTK